MSAKLPVWYRDVTYGSHGDVYIVDNMNSILEKNVFCEEGMRYNKPLTVKLTGGELTTSARPQGVTFLEGGRNEQKMILVTMDNKSLMFLTPDLTLQKQMKLSGRCSGICVGPNSVVSDPSQNRKPCLFALNATSNSLDVLAITGELSQQIPLSPKLGLRETHGYLCSCKLVETTVVIITSSRGLFYCSLVANDDGYLSISASDEIPTDEGFSPQGVCAVDTFVYVANSRSNRVMKMEITFEDTGEVKLKYNSYMSVRSPCAVDARKAGDTVSVCVTTLTGQYELLEF